MPSISLAPSFRKWRTAVTLYPPLFLLILAVAIDSCTQPWVAWIALASVLALAVAGVVRFYTLPRYGTDDYRPLIRQIVQQSTEKDTFLATFPWQVGFWRTPTPVTAVSTALNPQLLSDISVEWDDNVPKSYRTRHPIRHDLVSTHCSPLAALRRSGQQLSRPKWCIQRCRPLISAKFARLDGWRRNSNLPIQKLRLTSRGLQSRRLQLNGVGVAPQQVPATTSQSMFACAGPSAIQPSSQHLAALAG